MSAPVIQPVTPGDPLKAAGGTTPTGNKTTKTPKPPKTPPPVTPPPAPTPAQQGALDWLKATLTSWGLGSLYTTAAGYLTSGLSADEVTLKLQETPEFKTRFAGNEQRKALGLPVLSPAEYLATEEQYRNVLQQYGLPSGFYDQHSDFTDFIGKDLSPAELQSRAQIASQQYIQAPQEFRDYWKQFGLSEGQALAAILDPGHESLAQLQVHANAVAIGGSAAQQGVTVSGSRAVQLAQNGVTLDQARQAYSRIAAHGQNLQQEGQRFGTQIDQTTQENADLLGSGDAIRSIELVNSEEASQFSGHGGASTQSNTQAANY